MPRQDPEARRAYTRAYYQANREKLIEAAKAWNVAHPEERRVGQKKWYATKGRAYREANRDQYREANRRWYAANPEKKSADNRTQRLRRNFGLTVAQYEEMLAAQNGLCALCGQPETSRGRNGEQVRLAVDHDHVTGSVRALLCRSCNTGIGSFFDNPALLYAAAGYIEGFRATR